MNTVNKHQVEYQLLRTAYEGAFEKWSDAIQEFNTLTAQPEADQLATLAAKQRVDVAERVYRSRRDFLAEGILRSRRAASTRQQDAPNTSQQSIRLLAYYAWEQAERSLSPRS